MKGSGSKRLIHSSVKKVKASSRVLLKPIEDFTGTNSHHVSPIVINPSDFKRPKPARMQAHELEVTMDTLPKSQSVTPKEEGKSYRNSAAEDK